MKAFLRGVPLRIRLVAAVVALSAAGLALTGVVATAALHSYLLQRVDSQLASAVQLPGEQFCSEFPQPRGGPPRGHPQLPSQYYVAKYTDDGALTCSIHASTTDDIPALTGLTPARINLLSSHPFNARSVSGDTSWRVAVNLAPDGDVTVVGSPLTDVQHTVSRLIVLELVIGLVVLALIAAAAYFVIRRSLQPLVDVENTAVAIAGGDLSQRVPDLDPRTEVGRLTRALNAMLGQIEHAFSRQRESEKAARASEERMRRFVADASHELRTPLTSIRGFAELHRQGAVRDPREVARLMRRVEDEAMRMGMLVDDLLLLARMDQERPLNVIPVDLLTVVADVVHDARAVAPDRAIEMEVLGAPPIVAGDDARLHQVVQNLVTNALRHTPADTPVEVRLRSEGQRAVVEVVDHGPGLPADIRERVFERFYRVETSRSRDAGGAGLGLSIVSALVSAHGGSVEVVETTGGGATFRVVLPLAPAHSKLPAADQPHSSDSAESGSHA